MSTFDHKTLVNDIIEDLVVVDRLFEKQPQAAMHRVESAKTLLNELYMECWHSYHTSGTGPV